jgi:hypothetical protein
MLGAYVRFEESILYVYEVTKFIDGSSQALRIEEDVVEGKTTMSSHEERITGRTHKEIVLFQSSSCAPPS